MAVLTDPQKLFIVKALACYDTPTQVAAAVREEFGIEIDRRRVQDYDPTKVSGREVSARLREVFGAARKACLEELSELPIAHMAYRLRTLQRMVIKAESQGNMALVAQLLEQAAKEVGGALTNRRELTGKAGGPIQSESRRVRDMSDEELRALIDAGT